MYFYINVDWVEFDRLVHANILKDLRSSKFKEFDAIVGVSSGGLPLAVTLSQNLDIPMETVHYHPVVEVAQLNPG